MSDRFRIRVRKEQFVFSAAHFITFGDNICERLHGHNYHVELELAGGLNRHGYVVDFVAVRDAVSTLVAELDHHVLLPAKHSSIRVEEKGAEVEVRFEDRRWVFPHEDCAILPIANTTAELLAGWITDRFLEAMPSLATDGLRWLRTSVDENSGQWGICERTLSDGFSQDGT